MATAQKQEPTQTVERVRIRVPEYPSASTLQRAFDAYLGLVREIPGVEGLVVAVHGDLVFIQVVANNIAWDDRARISAEDIEITERFPEILWDLSVTDRRGTEYFTPDPEFYQYVDLQLQPA